MFTNWLLVFFGLLGLWYFQEARMMSRNFRITYSFNKTWRMHGIISSGPFIRYTVNLPKRNVNHDFFC